MPQEAEENWSRLSLCFCFKSLTHRAGRGLGENGAGSRSEGEKRFLENLPSHLIHP